MRVFIAIELDDNLRQYIFQKQQIVKKNSRKGNFSRKENFHLTLKFIGEVSIEETQYIKKAIDKTASIFSPFKMNLGELGYFPRKNRKIIWIGTSQGNKRLQQLFNIMDQNLNVFGFEREVRGLKPHITLAREVVLKKDFNSLSQEIIIENKELIVEKISLMESTRINGVLTYRPIYRKKL
ncbi:RNA 2',3'-cyclic phosphodiesterase [Maledivibacter halophilus]|uniref:RNA 2',3'-cyclic phosphodiesterase n=1 Tax=Maledivibacter halophilus TaxID=36842 RepID=A0A1T5JCD9_9FIRM|nr:RNA 2',3'-cyclic phosphodiesterase [Maledivibacter halophilus]SKC48942.1 2'-5' RNA ligase [Maledivibacter halophilus]